jgi:hypothetical protein
MIPALKQVAESDPTIGETTRSFWLRGRATKAIRREHSPELAESWILRTVLKPTMCRFAWWPRRYATRILRRSDGISADAETAMRWVGVSA